jgi:hypothetical protein
MRRSIACAAIALLAARPVRAQPQDCQAEATTLRARLLEDARHARRWNTGWLLGFGAASAGQLALAVTSTNPLGTFDQDFKETLYVGAAKAGVGVVGHLLFPLRIEVPVAASDACADRDALRRALAEAARHERATFWLNHVGSFAVNLAGAIVLAERRSWQVGAASAALGYPVGLLSVYTAPRASWHEWRDREASWTIGASATGTGASLWLIGQF